MDFLSAFNLQERLRNIKDLKEVIIKKGIDEVKDELKDAFDWSDPKPIPEVAQIAETLWVGRLCAGAGRADGCVQRSDDPEPDSLYPRRRCDFTGQIGLDLERFGVGAAEPVSEGDSILNTNN
jgi:hypothetical protein